MSRPANETTGAKMWHMDHDAISDHTARALQHRLAVAQRDGRVPSVVASVARRAAPVWFGAAGSLAVSGPDGARHSVASDGDPSQLPTEHTQYRVGSITKTMVAVCVLRLVDRGEVNLSDRLGDHLPAAPAPDSTIHQLLSHTAGLASETPSPWWERTPGDIRPSLADVLTPDPLRHQPGQTFHYSNPGFGLLGELVASRAGRPWFDVLREDVLAPLGMTRTTYSPEPPHARGWAVHPWADVLLPEPAHDHGLLAAAGQLWSTPGDLCRFLVFLAGDGAGILKPETLERMRTPASAPGDDGWSGSYGLGVQQLRFGDRVLFGHTGSMPGFLAIALTSPDDGVAVVVQANAWSALALRELAGDLVQIVVDREPTMPAPWTAAAHVDAAAYELVGPWYWGAVATAITLRADGCLELAGIGARGRAARFAVVEDGRWRGLSGYYDGEYLETRRDAAGVVTHLDLGSFVFTRQPYAPGDVVPGGLQAGDWQV